MTPSPKILSPSRLARFYFQDCERFLRYDAVPRDARAAEGVPQPPHETRPVTQAILESGYRWEARVVAELLAGRVHLGPDGGARALTERVLDQAAAHELLCSIGPGESVYQPEIQASDSFYARYGLARDLVAWPPCRPDLVTCVEGDGGRPLLRIIDVKASPGVKLSHRIQATVYSLILEQLLVEWGAGDRGVAPEAGIWLAEQPEPELFDLRVLRPPIEQFLEHELSDLLRAPAGTVPWHLYFRCEWCE